MTTNESNVAASELNPCHLNKSNTRVRPAKKVDGKSREENEHGNRPHSQGEQQQEKRRDLAKLTSWSSVNSVVRSVRKRQLHSIYHP
jgi:hypothetical protein